MPDEVVLGVDIGSSRIKAAAYDQSGRPVALESVPTPVRIGTRTDFPVLQVLDAAEGVMSALGLAAGSVAGVGITTMGEVGTVLGSHGLDDVSFPAWHDDRGLEVIQELTDEFGSRWLAGVTGGHARTTSSMAKLAWLQRQGVPLRGRFLGVGSALAWMLTGEVFQDASLAATSGAFNPARREFADQIWRAAGLDNLQFPPVVPPGTGAPARNSVPAKLGIKPGSLVIVAGHDHLVAAVGTGAHVGDVVDSLGTGEPLLAAWDTANMPGRDDVADIVEANLTLESWPSTGDLALIWEGLKPGLAMETFLRAAGRDRAELDLEAPPPGAAGLLDRAQVERLEKGDGADVTTADAATWAGLLDRYAVDASRGEEILREATGAKGATVLTGGGLRSTRWIAAKLAFSQQRPIVSPATETAARGSAAIVGASLGWWPDAAAMPGIPIEAGGDDTH